MSNILTPFLRRKHEFEKMLAPCDVDFSAIWSRPPNPRCRVDITIRHGTRSHSLVISAANNTVKTALDYIAHHRLHLLARVGL